MNITPEQVVAVIEQHEKEHDLHFMPLVKAHMLEIVWKVLNPITK